MRLMIAEGIDAPDRCNCQVCTVARSILGMDVPQKDKHIKVPAGMKIIGNYYEVKAYRCEGCNYVSDSEAAMHHHIITGKCEW